jgi:hypothetical protein
MKRRGWKLWVAGVVLAQLLFVEVGVLLLWPGPPSEAEQVAARIPLGMTVSQVKKVFLGRYELHSDGYREWAECNTNFGDGSRVFVEFGRGRIGWLDEYVAKSVRTTPAIPVHPLTRLHRTLARVLPFLTE